MQNFWEVLFSPVAISKFTHATSTSFIVAALFVITISAIYILRGRYVDMAKKSILVASVFGLISTVYVAINGDESAYSNASTQPMKLAAYEGLWDGEHNAGIVAFGLLNGDKQPGDDLEAFSFEIKIPGGLAFLANREFGSFVPGINDLVYGNEEQGIMSTAEKMEKGKKALEDLTAYKAAKKAGDEAGAAIILESFNVNKEFLGYGFLEKPEDIVPPVPLTFWAFHVMVYLSLFFGLVFLLNLVFILKGRLLENKWVLVLSVPSFFLAMLASQAGWVVAEVGRQPWAIQDMLPVHVSATDIAASNVQITFFMFMFIFPLLLIAEVGIMLKQIKKGPEGV
jgi:cytochrome d ubiquinol oxidase subunit I